MKSILSTNGVIALSNDQVHIAREADFNDFIVYAPVAKKQELAAKLKQMVRQFGEQRSPVVDLLRDRLKQVRMDLARG